MADFIHTPKCPKLVREEYSESQVQLENEEEQNMDQEDEQLSEEELLVEPDAMPEANEQDYWMASKGTFMSCLDNSLLQRCCSFRHGCLSHWRSHPAQSVQASCDNPKDISPISRNVGQPSV